MTLMILRNALLILSFCMLANNGVLFAEQIPQADRVVVKKAQKKLILFRNGVALKEYSIALGPRPQGRKQQEGDERTPEGSYVLDFKNPDSDYHKSIHISYPNQQDLQRAAALGVNPGGSIMIHGTPNEAELPESLIQSFNWTDGCIAVTNREMDEIWLAVREGTPIDILP